MKFGRLAGRGVWVLAAAWQVAALSLEAQDAGTGAVQKPSQKPSQTLDTVVVQDVPVDQNILPTAPTTSIYGGIGGSIQDTPRVVNQINASQIRDTPISSPNDFIYYTPGLTRQASQGDPVQPFIRGQAGQVYINGFLAGVSGSWLGPGFSNNSLESVDIVAGPASVVYGPSSLTSGYVNYVTKQGYFDKFHGSVQTDFGSWVSGGASYPNFKQTIDFGAPIVKDQLAYRVSIQKQEADGYYDGTENNYNDVYAAINWIPNKDFEVDYNIQWKTTQQLYTSGQNRRTQDLVDNGTYLAGPAIPIIRLNNGQYYSPVFNASRQVTGYVLRTANTATQRYTAGAAFDPTAAFAGNNNLRGQIVGYVLDPASTTAVHVYGNETNTGDTGIGADWDLHQQARAKLQYNDDLVLLNEADLDLGSITLSNAAGPSTYSKQTFFEDRAHAQLHEQYDIGSLNIDHQSDSGIAFRYENTNNDSKTSPTTNAFGDMLYSADPNVNLGGAQVTGSNGYVPGGTSTYFGAIPVAWAPRYNTVPYGNYLATPGSVFQDWDGQVGVFSQHNVKFGDQWGLNVGGRFDTMYVHVDNPITSLTTATTDPNIAGATATSLAGGDESSFILPQVNSSLTYKPVPWTTTYLTFDYGQAYNGSSGSPANFSLTGVSGTSAGTLAPANFHSASLLYEAGAKFEFIPNQLFGSIAGFYQERSQYNTLTNTGAPLEAHGVDASIRYQPAKAFNMGVNGEFINAHYSNYSFSSAAIYSANGIPVDNATLFGSSQFTNTNHTGAGNYRVPNIPDLNLSAFADYKFDFGLGFTGRYWWTSSAPIDVSNTVIIPDQWNLDLGAYYERPRWRAEVDLTNATNNKIIELNGTGFLAEAPIGVSGRIRFTF